MLDIDSEPRTNNLFADIGSDEFWPQSCTGSLSATISAPFGTNVLVGKPLLLSGEVQGRPLMVRWDFGDGNTSSQAIRVTHAYASSGVFAVVLQVTNITTSARITNYVTVFNLDSSIIYVTTNGNDIAGGTNWASAKLTLQAAVDAAPVGGVVLVSNGVFASGGSISAFQSNRVAVYKPLAVRSVNGPHFTTIKGAGSYVGDTKSMRGAYLASGAMLSGFTIRGGFSLFEGGGVYADHNSIISNCIVVANRAGRFGGGVCGGIIVNSMIISNTADAITLSGRGGGAYNSTIMNCHIEANHAQALGGGIYHCEITQSVLTRNVCINYGGGAAMSVIKECDISNNTAGLGGGGAVESTLYECNLIKNQVTQGNGGGAKDCSLYSCSLVDNAASTGGGATGSSLYSCFLSENTAFSGGAASWCSLYNCTAVFNSAPAQISPQNLSVSYGGGMLNSTAINSIVYYNTAPKWPNYDPSSTISYSCIWPLAGGAGNFTNNPRLVGASNPAILSDSPCRNSAQLFQPSSALDINRLSRTNEAAPDIGCYEFNTASATGQLGIALTVTPHTNSTVSYPLRFDLQVTGRVTDVRLSFGDGMVASNSSSIYHSYATTGKYAVVAIAINANTQIAVTTAIHVVDLPSSTRYVSTAGNDLAAGTNWTTSKVTIQAAISATPPCGLVLVSNGIYDTGAPISQSRISISNGITVRSVNGPAFTTIQGAITSSVRAVWMENDTILSGFTVRGGSASLFGGGIFARDRAIVSNCVIKENTAYFGGGVCNARVMNSDIMGNVALQGGGSAFAHLIDCAIQGNTSMQGGGAYYGSAFRSIFRANRASLNLLGASSYNAGGGATEVYLNGCLITSNVVVKTSFGGGRGGGLENCEAVNCQISDNMAPVEGGGALGGQLLNCSVVANTASNSGGGCYSALIVNSIIVSNSAPSSPNISGAQTRYSCSFPIPSGVGNFSTNPLFADYIARDLRIMDGSGCIDRGEEGVWLDSIDYAGQPRIVNGLVDVGAHENQSLSGYWSWITQVTNGITQYGESAVGDDIPNLLKYALGFSPTNFVSSPVLSPGYSGSAFRVHFYRNTNATDVTLLLEQSRNLGDANTWIRVLTNRHGVWSGQLSVFESVSGTVRSVTASESTISNSYGTYRLKITRP